MKLIVEHFQKLGLEPYKGFVNDAKCITYSDGQGGWISVERWRGKTYRADRVIAYSSNACARARYDSTRQTDIIKWINQQLDVEEGATK